MSQGKCAISLQNLKENVKDEVDFFTCRWKSNFSIALDMYGQDAQITQNIKFAISLQYLKEESDEIDFLHAYKHECFLQIDAMIFDWDGQAFPKFPK